MPDTPTHLVLSPGSETLNQVPAPSFVAQSYFLPYLPMRTRTYSPTYACMHALTHAHTHPCMHAPTYIYTHACTHPPGYTRTHARTHTVPQQFALLGSALLGLCPLGSSPLTFGRFSHGSLTLSQVALVTVICPSLSLSVPIPGSIPYLICIHSFLTS